MLLLNRSHLPISISHLSTFCIQIKTIIRPRESQFASAYNSKGWVSRSLSAPVEVCWIPLSTSRCVFLLSFWEGVTPPPSKWIYFRPVWSFSVETRVKAVCRTRSNSLGLFVLLLNFLWQFISEHREALIPVSHPSAKGAKYIETPPEKTNS